MVLRYNYALSLAEEILLTESGIPVQHVAKPLLVQKRLPAMKRRHRIVR